MVVTREPEWDDLSQAKALALLDVQADTHSCGHPLDEATDPETVAVVETFTCAYCRAVEQVERRDRNKHEKSPEKLDGVFWYARPYDAKLDASKPKARSASQRTAEAQSEQPARRGRLATGS